ncbi:MAG: NAD(P)H-hydrate dehydratase [Planctomycetia bacterium]|nr:NAD(P)H-hydrate dehydratase [Planctomycetia bacterium]
MFQLLNQLRNRPKDAHKGTFGTVLVIGGGRGIPGAPSLCAQAALRSGAGLVRVAVPQGIWQVVASFAPEYTVVPLPEDAEGLLSEDAIEPLLECAQRADVVAVGPGIGRGGARNALVKVLWQTLPNPAVFDADAINALASLEEIPPHAGARFITPHSMEFSRLCPSVPPNDRERQKNEARAWARVHDAIVVLKGNETQICDANSFFFNPTGNPGMGTGGSGDALTGILAAICAQTLKRSLHLPPNLAPPTDVSSPSFLPAARLAVYLHGLAGDLAAQSMGEVSLIAGDLIRFLPQAWQNA